MDLRLIFVPSSVAILYASVRIGINRRISQLWQNSVKSRSGILFSKKGISGEGKTKDAEREQLKVFQDRGMVIVVVDENDIKQVANGENFVNMLKKKYERVRLDLISES